MPTVTKLQYLMSWEWEWSESWFLLILLCSLATQRESAGGNSTNKETRETNLGEVLQKANSVEPDVSEQRVGGAMIVWKVGTRKGTTAGDYNEEERFLALPPSDKMQIHHIEGGRKALQRTYRPSAHNQTGAWDRTTNLLISREPTPEPRWGLWRSVWVSSHPYESYGYYGDWWGSLTGFAYCWQGFLKQTNNPNAKSST